MTPWYAYLGGSVAIVSLTATLFAIVRRAVRFARKLGDLVERAVAVLEDWPETSAAVERHAAELLEASLALGRVDAAQRKNHEDVDELWRRWRARFPDDDERYP